jgi:hypothetical protein
VQPATPIASMTLALSMAKFGFYPITRGKVPIKLTHQPQCGSTS